MLICSIAHFVKTNEKYNEKKETECLPADNFNCIYVGEDGVLLYGPMFRHFGTSTINIRRV